MGLPPQLRQRRDLLRMTGAEVRAYLEWRARENPALERVRPEAGAHVTEENPPEGQPAVDVYVEEEGGEYDIYFPCDDDTYWRVSLGYTQALMSPETAAGERESVKANVRSAVDLLRDVEHRRMCIYSVVEYIARSQPDFWGKGPGYIKPASAGEVARATGMGESAVSLAVAGKLIQTRHGVLELGRFIADG